MIASAYSTLLNPLLTLFSNTLTSVISLIKRSLHKYTFLALSSFASLSFLQPRWDNLLSRRLGSVSETRREANNELKDGLHALRAVCLRSFPEFLADVKLAAMGKGGELNTGLADVTTSVCGFLAFLQVLSFCLNSFV
jgi:exocyst complex protein 7